MLYDERKGLIRRRLDDFRAVLKGSEEEVFSELAFCLCTPQSSARVCDAAIRGLAGSGVLFRGDADSVRKGLVGVRFCENKARYIVEAREAFSRDGKLDMKSGLRGEPFQLREWLVGEVKGLGYKEASHFLRNVGMGEGLAILDRHILRNLVRHGVIPEIPKSLTGRKYLEIEKAMMRFSERIRIPMGELDLLFWSRETGEVFK